MPILFRVLHFLFVPAFSAVALGACDQAFFSRDKTNMNSPPSRLQPLFEKTRAVCFGRFIIDVPFAAHVVYGRAEIHSPIERIAGEGERMQLWIEKRLKEIEEEKAYALVHLKEGPNAMYGKSIDGILPAQKILFGVDAGSGAHYRVESFFKLGSDIFIQETRARTVEQIRENGGSGSVAEAIAKLNDTARKIRSRTDDEMPGEVGVCIDGAFVAKPLGVSGENFTLGIRFEEFPDVHFSVNTRINDRDLQQETMDEMLHRQKEAERNAQRSGHGAWYAGIKFLRRGEREFNGGKGYELLARKPAQGDGTENHQFVFEGGGEAKNELRPAFEMQLDTGASNQQTARVRPSLSDEEAVALWDKLISSIRVRPTGTSKASQAVPGAPLGERHVTGHRCPQTGWWECDDQLDLAQRSGLWLEKGQLMPMALVWREPSLWQQLKSERPVGKTPAVWRLAAYERPPGDEGTTPPVRAQQPPTPPQGTSGS